jgi:hypothetical protein
LLVAVPAWAAVARWGPSPAARRPIRLVWVGLLALMVAGPVARAPDVGTTVVLVVDRSASVSAGLAKQRENELLRRAEAEAGSTDVLAIVGFGSRACVERFPLSTRPPEANRAGPHQSKLHSAVSRALDLIEPGQRGRVIVLSDGLATDELTPELERRLRRGRTPVDYVAIQRPSQDDVAIESVRRLESAAAATPAFAVTITSSRDTTGQLTVLRDGVTVGEQPIKLIAPRTTIEWRSNGQVAPARYTFQITAPGDAVEENNLWELWVGSAGEPRLLVISGDDPSLLRSAAGDVGLNVDVLPPGRLDHTLERLTTYDACVLANASLDGIDPRGLRSIVRYVEQLGGGLVITGGERSLGAGGYRSSPLEPLLPVVIRPLSAIERPPTAVVVVVDLSSWDADSPRPQNNGSPLQTALIQFSQQLDTTDRIGIVTTRVPNPVILPLVSPSRSQEIHDAVADAGLSNTPGSFPDSLDAARKLLAQAPQLSKHLVVCASWEQLGSLAATAIRAMQPSADTSVSVIARGSASESLRSQLLAATAIASAKVRSAVGPEDLAAVLTDDWYAATGGGFVNRSVLATLSDQVSPGSARFRVRGHHVARVRSPAATSIVVADDRSLPLAARWDRGLGRVATLLFPVEAAAADSTDAAAMVAAVGEHLAWAARNEGRADIPVTVTQDEDAVTATVRLDDVDLDRLPGGGPLELTAVPVDSTGQGRTAEFRREAGALVATLTLDRSETHMLVIGRGKTPLHRGIPVCLPRSPEFLRPNRHETGVELLKLLAAQSGGAQRGPDSPLFDEPLRSYRSLVPWLATVCLLILVLDIADRRYGIVWSALLPWATTLRRRAVPTGDQTDVAAVPDHDVFEAAKQRSRHRTTRE